MWFRLIATNPPGFGLGIGLLCFPPAIEHAVSWTQKTALQPSLRLNLDLSSISLCRDESIVPFSHQSPKEMSNWSTSHGRACWMLFGENLSSSFVLTKGIQSKHHWMWFAGTYYWSFGESIWLTMYSWGRTAQFRCFSHPGGRYKNTEFTVPLRSVTIHHGT